MISKGHSILFVIICLNNKQLHVEVNVLFILFLFLHCFIKPNKTELSLFFFII